MSANLHEMHALLQQLRELDASHDLDHCEGQIWDNFAAGAARSGNGLVAGVTGAATMVGGAHKAYKDAKLQKLRDEAVLKAWGETDPTKKTQVLQRVFNEAGPDVLGPVLLGNEVTKYMTQECILPCPTAQK